MKCITSRTFAAPILNAQIPDKITLIIQMEIRMGVNHTFEETRDKRAFEIVSKIVSGILERIYVNARTAENHDRAYIILKTFSEFMGKKEHAALSSSFEDKFPDLFGFEKCGLLMIDAENSGLYKITPADVIKESPDENAQNPERTINKPQVKPFFVRYPKDRGLTSHAIKN